MSNIIGIDLGTTYSVIAVYGEVKAKGNYPELQYFPECNITLIPDPDGTTAIPSAFWCNPDYPSEKVFGYDAKELAKEGKTPILFSKRSIGTTEILKIGDKNFTAKEVATEYLKYLKKCAETAMGYPVNKAVITHPAYFSLNQVEETKQAAIDAGFDMSDNEQMLMEPVAAAMAFIVADPREEITVLAYDLGGGTFDVTVLEKKHGLIISKAFDGNHLLGGYNFDKKLISWLLSRVRERIKESGRTFEIAEGNSSDQSCWSRLLQIAEKIKIELTNKPTPKAPVTIKIENVLFDTEGKSIQIIDRINREEYTALIADLLEDTIERSNNAIKKAGLSNQDIDLILLVGGSSHGQWVREAVQKAFPENIVMHHDSPDLVVAIGAAIISEQFIKEDKLGGNKTETAYDYTITVDIPYKTNVQSLKVIGSVRKSNGDMIEPEQLDDFYLMIRPDENNIGAVKLNQDGFFLFRDIELLVDDVTKLTIELYDNNAILRCKEEIAFEYTDGGSGAVPTQVVPKSIFIKTANGLVTIAKEGERLPVKSKEIRLIKLNDDQTINLDIYQENDWVAAIVVDEIPEAAGEGSKVTLNIGITKKNIMQGKVVVKNTEGKLVAESNVNIAFPPIYIPELDELKEKFEKLENKRQEEIYNERDPKRRATLGGGDKIADKIKGLFAAEGMKDRQEINQTIQELEKVFVIKKDEFEPPKEEYEELLKECNLLIELKKDEKDYSDNVKILAEIEKTKNESFLTKDKRKWSVSFNNLRKLHHKLTKVQKKEDEDEEQIIAPTDELKDYFHEHIVDDLRTKLRQKKKTEEASGIYKSEKHDSRVEKIKQQINQLSIRINAIPDDTKNTVALAKLQALVREKSKIKKRLKF